MPKKVAIIVCVIIFLLGVLFFNMDNREGNIVHEKEKFALRKGEFAVFEFENGNYRTRITFDREINEPRDLDPEGKSYPGVILAVHYEKRLDGEPANEEIKLLQIRENWQNGNDIKLLRYIPFSIELIDLKNDAAIFEIYFVPVTEDEPEPPRGNNE